jgi:hypothetical protein
MSTALAQEPVTAQNGNGGWHPSGSPFVRLQLLSGQQAVVAPVPTLLEQNLQKLAELGEMQAVAQDAKEVERLQKQVEIQQKQIDLLQKTTQLLADQVKKQASPTDIDVLRLKTASMAVQARQAAERDQQLAGAIDDLREQTDADRRWGLSLPSTLHELFLPSGTNETPLSIYGTLAFGYSKIIGDPLTAANGAGRPRTPGGFYFGEFTPDFFVKLNDWMLLSAEIGIGSDGTVNAGSFAQADFFINDWLTLSAGRFVTPIGFFNVRLNNPWINKLPGDAPGSGPLLWQQVLPALNMLGLNAGGAVYLGNSPFKLEYNAFLGNGLNLTPATAGAPNINELANLENMTNTFTFVSDRPALGGRVGLWWPEKGLAAGFSGLYNPNYIAGSNSSMTVWAADFNFHRGNWDFRAEYGLTTQQAKQFQADDITREGFYTQLAYRPRDIGVRYLENFEFVYRYSYVYFKGINPTALDLTTFSTPVDVPVRRQQNEFGINYYFYPRAVLKGAYQINDEPGFHLHDNQFIMEFAWGF